jgi:hypothetical protein
MDRFRMLPNYQYYNDNTGILETQYAKEMRDYQIFGNSIQDGTPSPDNPIEIQSVGDFDEKSGKYKIPIEVGGKNLFDINNLVETSAIKIIDNKTIVVSGYPSSTTKKLKELCPEIKVGQSIAFSMKTNGYNQIYFKNFNSGNTYYVSNGNSFTATEDLLNANLYFYRQTSAQGGGNATISNIQFELGTQVTEYEPYREPQTHNIFLDEPLRKVGDYADYIDFKNGKVVRYVRTLSVKNGSWSMQTSADGEYSYFVVYPLGMGWGGFILSPIYERISIYSFKATKNPQNNSIAIGSTGSYDGWMGIRDDRFADTTSIREALKDINFYAPHKTPTEEAIELPKIQLHKGTNIIKLKTTIQPSQVNWQYYK